MTLTFKRISVIFTATFIGLLAYERPRIGTGFACGLAMLLVLDEAWKTSIESRDSKKWYEPLKAHTETLPRNVAVFAEQARKRAQAYSECLECGGFRFVCDEVNDGRDLGRCGCPRNDCPKNRRPCPKCGTKGKIA